MYATFLYPSILYPLVSIIHSNGHEVVLTPLALVANAAIKMGMQISL